MNQDEIRATLTVALMAAFADGAKDERERDAIRKVADALGAGEGIDLPQIYREVLIARPDIGTVAARITTPEARQLAYELAVGVCEADGSRQPAEQEFLARLATALQLPGEATRVVDDGAAAVLAATAAEPTPPGPSPAGAESPASGTVQGAAGLAPAELDRMILNASVTNAALELLPESLATMAIIPLQLRLVHRIGRAHGYPMDMSNARDFVATLGVGLTGQYLEQFGRKLLGGALGKLGGGLGRGVGRQAASSGLSFATTYAIGRVAQRYYAAGRQMDTAQLKSTFSSLLEEARLLAPRYRAEIEQKAQGIDTREIASLIRQA
jgi:uncharacterized protein (DUF697 family)/tellurite resistance protein